ncbi:MAG: phosphoribosylformylglycinamidine synthase, partial [Gammaproteobacteria bacterium]
MKLTDAVHCYLLEHEAPPDETTRAQLAALLDEGEPAVADLQPTLFQLPRFGTISPWSSKASDIFADCGLAALGRVERGVAYAIEGTRPEPGSAAWRELESVLADRMTQVLLPSLAGTEQLFAPAEPAEESIIPLSAEGEAALIAADRRLGLALGQTERDYLLAAYTSLGRDPTETELMMFAQVNSEHCRHKIFRGRWTLDGKPMPRSLFDCIRESYRASPDGILSAYKDNAAVLVGHDARALRRDAASGRYVTEDEQLDIAIKVETHNHPTGVAPFPGAATGAGG